MSTNSSRVMMIFGRTSWALMALLVGFLAASFLKSRLQQTAEPKPYATPFDLVDQNGVAGTEKISSASPRPGLRLHPRPHICPTALGEMAQVLKELSPDADKLMVVFVSVDPARDTLALLKNGGELFSGILHLRRSVIAQSSCGTYSIRLLGRFSTRWKAEARADGSATPRLLHLRLGGVPIVSREVV